MRTRSQTGTAGFVSLVGTCLNPQALHQREERPTTDDKANRGEPDRSRISLSEDYEVRYWTETLGVSKEQLATAIKKVGNSPDAVRQALGK